MSEDVLSVKIEHPPQHTCIRVLITAGYGDPDEVLIELAAPDWTHP